MARKRDDDTTGAGKGTGKHVEAAGPRTARRRPVKATPADRQPGPEAGAPEAAAPKAPPPKALRPETVRPRDAGAKPAAASATAATPADDASRSRPAPAAAADAGPAPRRPRTASGRKGKSVTDDNSATGGAAPGDSAAAARTLAAIDSPPRRGAGGRPRAARKPAATSPAPAPAVAPQADPATPALVSQADPTTGQGRGNASAASAPEPAVASPEGDGNPLAIAELPQRLAENIERIEALGQRLLMAMAQRPLHSPSVEGPGPELYNSVTQAWLRMATEQPARLIEQQVRFWGQTLRHVAAAQGALARNLSAPPAEPPADRRFKNPLWQTNPFYHFVMSQYQINAEALRQAAADLELPDEVDRRRVEWFTRQMIDMLAPTNFLATNPDALERAIQTEGESLVRGLENLVRDIEQNRGDLVVSLSDRGAFRVGENIGTTPGEVVHRTGLFELIQFHPTTETVHRTPVVVFPPWINKYYIMDLKPQNSLLRWIVEQGFTLFVVSWKNPGKDDAGLSMDDYVSAYLEVIDKARELTDEPQLNAVGYCIAGTTLSATLALMKQTGDERVKSATFLTTLTDFSDQGEFTTFLQDDFVGGIEDEVAHTGYLSAQLMQRTFSFLRANDLIWGPAIRSYMLGETPPAFDLLYWNGDGTNLPGRMVTQYLRELCQQNALVEKGFEILGHRVRLSEVTLPLCAVACEGDHIAPWLHSWKGVAQMGSTDKTFILSESGHIAGIINPPSKVKYGHYTSDAGFGATAQDWRAAAEFHPGSWWARWGEWLAAHSGGMVPARAPQQSLAPAPGTYVLETA